MVNVALVGAGIFATSEHLPAIKATASLTLKAVYSRSQGSADQLAQAATSDSTDPKVDTYFDVASNGAANTDSATSLDALLARDDISAVVVCLPIPVQAGVVKKALAAGKHVLSEKPIAQDLATAKELLEWYNSDAALTNNIRPIWAVGENYRFMDSLVYGAQQLKELGGELVTFSLHKYGYVDDRNKYFHTAWRKTPQYQGGFVLDGGIHYVAGLRLLLQTLGQDISQVSAHTSLLQEYLPPVDTVHAVLSATNGRSGLFGVSFGTQFKSQFLFEITTTKGSVKVAPVEVVVTRVGAESHQRKEDRKEFDTTYGVPSEMDAFAASIAGEGKVNPLQSTEEALQDLKILEAILRSGEQNGAQKSIS